MMIIFMFIGISLAPAATALTLTDDLVRLAGYGEERLSTVVVSGSLFCGDESHPIPGASVAVWCTHTDRKSSIIRGKTDKYGDFLVDLPSHLHAIPNMEKRCRLTIVGIPRKSLCHRAAKNKHIAPIKLLSSENGIRNYSTHKMHLKRSHPFRGRIKPYTSNAVIHK